MPVAGPVALKEVGAHGRADRVEETADDPVFVQSGHGVERRLDLGRRRRLRIVSGARRIEPRDEQVDEPAHDAGIGGEGLRHVRLAEGDLGLAQVPGVSAQHDDLAPVQPGTDDQAVEGVVFRLAAPHPDEGGRKPLPRQRGVEFAAGGDAHSEVVNPHVRLVAGKAIGKLVDDAQPHVLERGQHVGQRELFAATVDLEAGAALGRVVEMEREAVAAARGFDASDVVHRGIGREPLAVGQREGGPIAAPQGRRGVAVVRRGERRSEIVVPAAQRRSQPRLDLFRAKGRHRPRHGPHDHVQARERVVAELREIRLAGAVERRFESLRHQFAQTRSVALARHEDEARDRPLEGVAPREQAHPRARVQVENAEARFEKRVFVVLEQLAARQRLEHVQEGTVVVALGGKTGTLANGGDLAPQQRHLGRRAVVGARREQAEEAVDADDVAGAVVALHLDRIHRNRPVHRRSPRALGHDQRLRAAQPGQHLGRDRPAGRGGSVFALLGTAHESERGARGPGEAAARLVGMQIVAAIAEVGEMAVRKPAQKRRGLVETGAVRRGVSRDLRGGPGEGVAHRLPVGDGETNVVQDMAQAGGQGVAVRAALRPVDLDAHDGLDRPLVVRTVVRAQIVEPAGRVTAHPVHRVRDEPDSSPPAGSAPRPRNRR